MSSLRRRTESVVRGAALKAMYVAHDPSTFSHQISIVMRARLVTEVWLLGLPVDQFRHNALEQSGQHAAHTLTHIEHFLVM